ncbi:MAG: hypothetical protein GY679_01230 [Mycoplasma sp.]|nr:hypothetical protein [Mycoplasma sp.]
MLKIEILRRLASYDYKYDKNKDDYQNNTKNNMIDELFLYDGLKQIFKCNLQTVSNHPSMKHSDTIKVGKFKLKAFVEQRNFNTAIHGIIDAYDINNQKIDKYSMQKDGNQYIGRWLFHSCYYAPLKKDTRAYSGGCFAMSTEDIQEFNKILMDNGIRQGNTIDVTLMEVNCG